MPILLIGLVIPACSNATEANWSYFATVLRDHDIYVDYKRFEREPTPTLWVLFDSLEVDEEVGSKSVVQKYRADCKKNMIQTLETQYFEGPMGLGRLIRKSFSPDEWESPVVSSLLDKVLDLMCDRYLDSKMAGLSLQAISK